MNLTDFWQWIKGIQSKKLVLSETNNNVSTEVMVTKGNKGLFFELTYPFSKLLYDENSNLILRDNLFEIKINNYSVCYTKAFGKKLCTAYILESSNLNKEELFYYKYYSKVDTDLKLFSFLKGDDSKVKFKLNDVTYTIDIELFYEAKEYYLLIESKDKVCFNSFKKAVSAIIVSIGFLSGYYYRFEEYYFHSSDKLFENEIAFFYRSSDQKMAIYEPFTQTPSIYNKEETSSERFFAQADINIFSRLAEFLFTKPNIYITLVNIFKIYKVYPLFTCSVLYVTLEVLCDEINKEHNERVDKIITKEHGFSLLADIKDKISNEHYSSLYNIIDQFDLKLVANNVIFERAFKSLRMNLSNDEVKILSMRNNFFHGRIIPVINAIESEEDYHKLELDYGYYSDRLYVMIARLILKKVGFSGYILNHAKIREKETGRNIKENYFIKI